jgi:uncharacterized Zn-binding protein involved in type VI secretion
LIGVMSVLLGHRPVKRRVASKAGATVRPGVPALRQSDESMVALNGVLVTVADRGIMMIGGNPVATRGDEMLDRITVKPEIHFGKPCVAGTRIPVQSVLELVREGIHLDDWVRPRIGARRGDGGTAWTEPSR